jgi:hypothetical protein
MHLRVGLQVGTTRNAAVLLLAARALLGQLAEVLLRRFVAYRDVNFALRRHIVGDLVLAAPRKILTLKIILREDMVHIHQQVLLETESGIWS